MIRRIFLGFSALIFVTAAAMSQEQKPTVTIAAVDGTEPAVFLDKQGTAEGIFPDVLAPLLRDLGYDPVFVTGLSFTEAYDAVVAGEIDILPAVIRTPERRRELDFNDEPVMVTWSQVFVREESHITGIQELAGKRVGLLREGQNAAAFVQLMDSFDIPFVPVRYSDYDSSRRGVLSGEVDAMVAFNTYYRGNPGIHPTSIVFAPTSSHIATAAGTNAALFERIDTRLRELKANPGSYYHRILSRWLQIEEERQMPLWVITIIVGGAIALVVSLVAIVSYRRRVDRVTHRLEQSETKFRALFDLAADSVLVYGLDGDMLGLIVEANDGACERLGYTRDQLFSMTPEDIVVAEHRERYRCLHKGLTRMHPMVTRADVRDSNGERMVFEISARRFASAQGDYVIAVARDIGDRLDVEQKLRASLEAKETLLREIHHRVKNNLQTIASLLNIRIMSSDDEQLQRALGEMADRVSAMGLLHRMLYQNDDFSAIDVDEYTQGLCRQVWSSHAQDTQRIRLSVEAEAAMIDLDTALPFGLIVNEAVTNALKHAFPHGAGGTVHVAVNARDGDLELQVSDDGIGMVAEPLNGHGMGMQMINLLAKQLDGQDEVARNGGTTVTVRFPRKQRSVPA